MASEKKSYPYLPAKSWWALRKRFRQTKPSHVTPRYLVTVLGGKERSAKGNVLPALKAVGLVEDDGKTTDRANMWRDDDKYSEVCRQIREEVYPRELLDALPGPAVDMEAAKRWFMATTGCGEQAAAKMARLYSLLTVADPSKGDEAVTRKPKRRKSARSKKEPRTADPPANQEPEHQQPDTSDPTPPSLDMPELRLNVEIRIDASVTPAQIDQIFASMAKHLYRRDDEGR